jgi:hypothetical protein
MLSKESLFLRLGAKTKGKGVATTVPPKHLKGLEKYLWKWRLFPIEELDQLLLLRNVGLDADGNCNNQIHSLNDFSNSKLNELCLAAQNTTSEPKWSC